MELYAPRVRSRAGRYVDLSSNLDVDISKIRTHQKKEFDRHVEEKFVTMDFCEPREPDQQPPAGYL